MKKQSVSKFKKGQEYIYHLHENHEPVCVVFIEEMKSGLKRFFVSERPSLEYHVRADCIYECPDKNLRSEPKESYAKMAGPGAEVKEEAYRIFFKIQKDH